MTGTWRQFGKVILFALVASPLAWAQSVPECMNRGSVLPVDNQQVIKWKTTTKDQFHSRGHIDGVITKIYPDETGHKHIEATIGDSSADTIEVIYSESFGPLPQTMKLGSQVEACGDYITANTGRSASPDGALIHWVHKSTSASHDSGYVIIDGTLCGYK